MPDRLLALLRTAPFLLALAAPAAGSGSASGPVYLTVEEALELAFPEGRVERTTVFLGVDQLERASELAGEELDRRIVYPYVARDEHGELVGTAYFDTHDVRTKKETVMVVVHPDDTVGRIEVLAFAEPEDYIPRSNWYARFLGCRLDDDLRLKRDIPNVTGATLTALATTNCARRTLALHRVTEEARRSRGDGGGSS